MTASEPTPTSDATRDLAALRQAAAVVFADEPVRFAYLFGSRARGEARPGSDVDVAALFGDEAAAATYLERTVVLAGRLAVQSGVGPIDGMVALNDAPLRLVGRILAHRVVLFSRDEPARVAFEVRMRSRALDFELHAAPLDRELLAAMARHG